MAGSLVWRPYEATIPGNASFSVQVDESNARATYNGNELMPVGALGILKPGATKMRHIRAYPQGNPKAVRKFYVSAINLWQLIASDPAATLTAPYGADPTDATGGQSVTWVVQGAVNEKNTRRARVLDSGLVDGTPAN
jgi:hypothetical protein